jgi:D-alanyl-D-alanine carboxypeptidase/D-alanyl-D-alanine-endopeptidase (penicillin-binding protein 4)
MPAPPVPLIPLVRHRSLPLTQLIKQMNIYSNNPMAEMLAVQLGGAPVIARQAAIAAQVPAAEIQLVNGSGLSPDNRMSPRAVCGLFQALQRLIQPQSLADLFPVSGRDLGTLELREIPEQAVVKTGTLWNVSTLAGMLPNREYGPTCFAILNHGEGIDRFRQQQDQLLQSLEKQWGPAPGRASQVPLAPGRLGEPQRNEVLLVNRP